jgi:hypothetical protein
MAMTFDKDEQSLITLPNGQYMGRNVTGATVTAWTKLGQQVFTAVDVGTSTAGTYSVQGDTHIIQGSGDDIWSTSDGMRFAYFQITGDATITAQVLEMTATHAHAKACLMMRKDLSTGSQTVEAVAKPLTSSLLGFDHRSTANASTVGENSVNSPLPNDTVWLRVVRSGNDFSGYYSTDGLNFTQMGTTQTIAMGTTIYCGMAVSSHVDGSLATAKFDNVTITGQTTASERWIIFVSNGLLATAARLAISIYTTGKWRATGRRMDADGATTVDAPTVAEVGRIYFVAARFGFSTQALDLFVDGELVATTANATWTSSSEDTEPFAAGIGCRGGGATGYFDGTIDDVRLYHEALPDHIIKNLFICKGQDRSYGYVRWKLREAGSGTFARREIKDCWAGGSDGATDTFIDTYPIYATENLVSAYPRQG